MVQRPKLNQCLCWCYSPLVVVRSVVCGLDGGWVGGLSVGSKQPILKVSGYACVGMGCVWLGGWRVRRVQAVESLRVGGWVGGGGMGVWKMSEE